MKKIIVLISVFICLQGVSQIGGTKTYRFLDIPMTARAAALGGSSMGVWGDDINLIYSNPALLNPSMVKQAAFNYCSYVGDLKFGYVAYAHALKKQGTVAGSLQFYDYGKFVGYDELGQKTNNFNANDYSINLTYAKPLADSLFNVGIAVKTIISQYDSYKSFASGFDFGVTYHTKKDLTISLLAKNIGIVWKSYTANQNDGLPQTVQLGASFKPKKAPFRLFIVYDQLLKWKVKYVSPIDTAGKSNTLGTNGIAADSTNWQKLKYKSGNFLDNFMRHLTFGTEIVLTKNFNLRIAYNYRRQREFTLPDRRGANGLSFGFGFKVKRFGFSYSFTKMAFPGNSSIFGITARL